MVNKLKDLSDKNNLKDFKKDFNNLIEHVSDKFDIDMRKILINIYQEIFLKKLCVLSWIIYLIDSSSSASSNTSSRSDPIIDEIKEMVEHHIIFGKLLPLREYVKKEYAYVNKLFENNGIDIVISKNILSPDGSLMIIPKVNDLLNYYNSIYLENKQIKRKTPINTPFVYSGPSEEQRLFEENQKKIKQPFQKQVEVIINENDIKPPTDLEKRLFLNKKWNPDVKENTVLAGHHDVIKSLSGYLSNYNIDNVKVNSFWDKIYTISYRLNDVQKKNNEWMIAYAIKLLYPNIPFRTLDAALYKYILNKKKSKDVISKISLYKEGKFTPEEIIWKFYDKVFNNLSQDDSDMIPYKQNHNENKIIFYDFSQLENFIRNGKGDEKKKEHAIKILRKEMSDITSEQRENHIESTKSAIDGRLHNKLNKIIDISKKDISANIFEKEK